MDQPIENIFDTYFNLPIENIDIPDCGIKKIEVCNINYKDYIKKKEKEILKLEPEDNIKLVIRKMYVHFSTGVKIKLYYNCNSYKIYYFRKITDIDEQYYNCLDNAIFTLLKIGILDTTEGEYIFDE